MFSKQHKLTRKDFSGNFFVGNKFHTNTFTFIYNQNSSQKIRLGFLVSKKISKKAVVRNSLKRQLYGFLGNQQIFNLPYNILIVIKSKQYSDQLLNNTTKDLEDVLYKLQIKS